MERSSISLFLSSILIALAGCGNFETDLGPTSVARSAAVLAVPGEYDTLAEAIAAARGGDVIAVAAGEYHTGALSVSRSITIQGEGLASTIVNGRFDLGGADGVVLSGMTIRGDDSGVGIQGTGSYTVEGCAVHGFRYGITAGEASGEVVVRESRVFGNVWGIDFFDCDGSVVNNELFNNTAAGVVLRSYCGVDIFHNTVVGNGFSGDPDAGAGGITLGPFGSEEARNNIVVGNAYGINCIHCRDHSSHNDVWGNLENYVGDAAAGPGDLSLDPRFVNPAEADFRLAPDSPCIDAGTAVGVAVDAVGRDRPFGPAPDLGAFEHVVALEGLVINEVMSNPLSESTGEYVELFNDTDAAVDVAGLVLSDGDAVDVLQGLEGGATVIPAGGYALILDRDFSGDYELPAEAVLLTTDDATLGNALAVSDPVRLLLPDGLTEVSSYTHPFNAGNGVSVERIAPEAADVEASWVPSPCGASPGRANCAAGGGEPGELSLAITEVMANPLVESTGEFVEILNLGEAEVELAGMVLSDGDSDDILEGYEGGGTVVGAGGYAVVLDRGYAGQYSIPGGAVLLTVGDGALGNGLSTNDPVTLRDPGGSLLAAFSHPFDPGNGRSAEMVDVERGDAAANWIAAQCETPPYASPGAPNCASEGGEAPGVPTLVINEVMSNALDEDTGEFVELYNFGPEPVDAAGLSLDDGDASDALVPMAGGSSVVPAGGYALILDPEYAGEYPIPGDAVLLRPTDTTLGSGLATDDRITLRATDGLTVVSTYHHPFNAGNGISVERVDDRGDVESNWVASPCASGSSPGRPNCASGDEEPAPGDVPDLVINEVMANADDETTQEFIEIVNIGEDDVDLGGFILSDGDATDPIEGWGGGSAVIPAGGIGIVLDRDYTEGLGDLGDAVRLTVDDRTICSGLATNDPIRLLMPDSATVVSTFLHPFNPGNARSAERIDAFAADDPTNWVPSPCEGDPQASPGLPNCASGESDPRPDGVMVDVNTASERELTEIHGIGAVFASRIASYREANGPFEIMDQLTVFDGVTIATIEGWQMLEEGETHYLGIGEGAARIRYEFDTVGDLLAALPDPSSPGDWEGRLVRIKRATNITEGDPGTWRQFSFGDWGDEANFLPDPSHTILVYLGSRDRDDIAVIDALADWDNEDGAPYSTGNFYTWTSRASSGGRVRANHVFAVEGELLVYDGEWEIFIRTNEDPGMDRLLLYEKWLEADMWREVRAVWSYNYEPAVVVSEGFTMTLPYRLVTSHPCVAYWERVTGSPPPMPRNRPGEAIPGGYDEYNDALAAWLAEGG